MNESEFRAKYGREKPTPRERQTAARIRVRADAKLGRTTPDWIKKLANGETE